MIGLRKIERVSSISDRETTAIGEQLAMQNPTSRQHLILKKAIIMSLGFIQSKAMARMILCFGACWISAIPREELSISRKI